MDGVSLYQLVFKDVKRKSRALPTEGGRSGAEKCPKYGKLHWHKVSLSVYDQRQDGQAIDELSVVGS
ncbi:MAG TPA: hypothetical protein DD437_02815 [Rhodobiaceae bacterium]|nr:hypothetical protein [Rhodobiaceae bacterium]